jgi:hypothetical protein
MTSSSTIVSICNRALASFGARSTISSLTENSAEAQACTIFYNSTFEALARTARWGCLRREGPLTLLAAAAGTPENVNGTTLPIPPLPYLYSYASPSDSLFMRGILPNIPSQTGSSPPVTGASVLAPICLPNNGMIPFKVAFSTDLSNNPIEVILCNLSMAVGVWTTNSPNPVIFDSLFEQALVSSLAAFLIPALSLNLPLLGAMIKNAESAIMQARTADGNETPSTQDRQASWISARMAGTLVNWDRYNSQYSFGDMCWPGAYGGFNGGGSNIS